MSRTQIPAAIRRHVIRRAGGICEYCLMPEMFSIFGFEIDHIVAEKHKGRTTIGNLALACVFCNVAKGSDVGSIHWPGKEFTRLYDPRTDRWPEHFQIVRSRIEGVTPIGVVTARLLEFNRPKRLKERKVLIRAGLWPSPAARRLIEGK